jgi:hypothetical protein
MRHPQPGNTALVRARRAHGWIKQKHLCDAFEECASALGLRLEVSERQVRRWESADPPWPTPDYERVLRALFGVHLDQLGFTRPAHLVNMDIPEQMSDNLRWRAFLADVPDSLHRLVALEESALSVRSYQTAVIPGLLQTPDYAFAAIQASDPTLSADAVYERQRLRMDRIERFAATDCPAWFILAEDAIHRPVGGEDVLVDQLGHLLLLVSRKPHTRIHILPSGSPFTLSAPCVLYELAPARTVVWLEQLTASFLVDRPDDVLAYQSAYAHLQAAALPVVASLEMIDTWRRTLCCEIEMRRSGGSRPTPSETTASRSPTWDTSEYETRRWSTGP